MATIADRLVDSNPVSRDSGNPLARAIDRWIYVLMASWFILITLVGFIPFTLDRLAANRAGTKPPFPPILHVHAVVMSAFLLLLLAQAVLMATGRSYRHQWLGRAAVAIVPAMIVVMIMLVPASYHENLRFAQSAAPAVREKLLKSLGHDNTLLLEIREIILFPVFMYIALRARRNDPALHKRLMFLGTAVLLIAAINRMVWLPRPFGNFIASGDLYLLVIVSPMFIWDVIRTRMVPKAYVVWISLFVLVSVPAYALWGTRWWFSTVPHLMGV